MKHEAKAEPTVKKVSEDGIASDKWSKEESSRVLKEIGGIYDEVNRNLRDLEKKVDTAKNIALNGVDFSSGKEKKQFEELVGIAIDKKKAIHNAFQVW